MSEKKYKLPKAGARRYGHRSHVRSDRMIRILGKTGYFEETLKREKKKYG